MNSMPLSLRKYLDMLPRMKRCQRCGIVPVEWHHAITGLGRKQLQEPWAIIALCHSCHVGKDKNDEIARHIAYQQATEDDFRKYPKRTAAWIQEKKYLTKKYTDRLLAPKGADLSGETRPPSIVPRLSGAKR